MPLPNVYPVEPLPFDVVTEQVQWPDIRAQFDSAYSQVRGLTDRPLRKMQLKYDMLLHDEADAIRLFYRQMKGRNTRFDYVHHIDLIRAPGFEIGPITAVPAGSVSFVPNSGFEDGDQGWKSDTGGTTIVNNNARSGSWAASKAAGGADTLRSTGRFPVRPGESFYISGWMKTTAGATGVGNIRAVFYDIDFTELTSVVTTGLSGASTSYVPNEVVGQAPLNAAWVDLEFLTGTTTGTWYADDLFIRRYPEAWSLWPTSGLVGNGITIQSTIKRSGSYALKIDPVAATGAEALAATRFPVFSGENLLLAGYVKADAVGASGGLSIQHFDAAGAYVSGDIAVGIGNTQNAKEWTVIATQGACPVGAVYAMLRCISDVNNTTGVDMYFDDLMVRRVIPCRFADDMLDFEFVPGLNRWRGPVHLEEAA